jgi:hypothetical protein
MMKSIAISLFTLSLLVGGAVVGHTHTHLCAGFVPPNDMKIPAHLASLGNVTEADFNDVLDDIEKYYTPVVANRQATLEVRRLWEDETVNASAMQWGSTYIINMYGGLARHPSITKDGFMLVACHEMGHHLGGAPKKGGWGGAMWASNEGQADYYSTLKCLRFMLKDEDNAAWVANNPVDPFAVERCQQLYNTQEEENLCIRLSMAGMSTADLFKQLRNEETIPAFSTPDPAVVSSTFHNHPGTQCRLDTYFSGSICVHDLDSDVSDSDPLQGTCNLATQDVDGVRPLCWYKP